MWWPERNQGPLRSGLTVEGGSKNKLCEKFLSSFGLDSHTELPRAESGLRCALLTGARDWAAFLSSHVHKPECSNPASLSKPQFPQRPALRIQ